ncbi:MAG TPA: hypothetical protein VF601_05330 [Beijerinckiaceae bacterium]|jgi:hypothetical protein
MKIDRTPSRGTPQRHALPVLLAAMLAMGASAALAQGGNDPAALAFRDTVDKLPPNPPPRRFRLSRDYPAQPPAACPECTWLNVKVDFTPQFPPPQLTWSGPWADYMNRILAYMRQGQDPQFRDEVGFQVAVNGRTRWFNVPWMAYDPTAGREFLHGTTNERTAHLSDFINGKGQPKRGVSFPAGTTQDCQTQYPHGFETWAVGYYNEWGGYALGKAIPKNGRPKVVSYLGSPMPDGLPFPANTVVVKFLTTNAPPDCVPYLRGSPEWRVNRHAVDPKTKAYLCRREVQVSRMIQVDVAVVDPRSPTRWVYGTFGYDGTRPGATFWDRLVPLGLQWGSDPWTFPAVPQSESVAAQQTVLNPDIKIFEHFGCNKRLAGPVDNKESSCVSCHASAFSAPNGAVSTMGSNVPPSFGFAGMCQQYSLDNASYFQNVQAPQSFPGGRFPEAVPLDTSLQLEVAFGQYGQFNTAKAPVPCKDPDQF